MNNHGQEILNLTDRVRGATAAQAAALPRGAWGAGPDPEAAQETTLEEVRAQAEAAGDPRDAPLSITDVSKTGRELGIREA